MNTSNEKAMRLAIEALEEFSCDSRMIAGEPQLLKTRRAITSLRQAIAEAEKQSTECVGEPVAEIALQYSKESVDWQCEQQIMAQAFMSEKHIQTSDKQKLVTDKLEHLLWQFIDLKAKFPECSPKPETWPHVLAYAPKVEQFPAAEAITDALLVGQFRVWQPFTVIPKGTKFYTTPYVPTERQQRTAERKPLTDEQIEACLHHVDEDGIGLFAFARAIEAAHGIHPSDFKEKNTWMS
jgi:hypothetical protein